MDHTPVGGPQRWQSCPRARQGPKSTWSDGSPHWGGGGLAQGLGTRLFAFAFAQWGGGGLHHTMVPLKLQQFLYNLKKIFLWRIVFPVLFGPSDPPPRGGGE